MRTFLATLALTVLSACTGATCEPSIGRTEGCPVEETDSDTVTNPDSDSDSDANVETDMVDTDSIQTDDTVDSTDTADSDTNAQDTNSVDSDDSDTQATDTDETDVTETDTDAAPLDTAHPCIPAVGWTAACPDTAETDMVDSDVADSDTVDTDVAVDTDETDETVTPIETADSDSVTPVETDTVDTLPQDTDSEVEPHETGDTFETGDTATDTIDTVETDSADTDAVIDPLTVDDDLDGYSEVDGDCEDANPTMYPEERTEWFDWADNDCDGTADEDCDTSCGYDYASQVPGLGYCRDDVYQFWLTQSLEFECVGHVTYVHLDLDHDGYTSDVDCKDWIDSIHPGAYDYGSDGVDQDCDGQDLDSGRFTDDDGDGYCESTTCTDGSLPGDCADWINPIHPGARDWGNDGVDQDCDGLDVDSTWLADDDLDGYTELEGDCDDGDIDTYPGAPEMFDWQDNDCDSHLIGADYGVDETCNTGCNWDYVSYHAGLGYCRDDLYQFWSTDQTGDGDLTWECTASTWYVQ